MLGHPAQSARRASMRASDCSHSAARVATAVRSPSSKVCRLARGPTTSQVARAVALVVAGEAAGLADRAADLVRPRGVGPDDGGRGGRLGGGGEHGGDHLVAGRGLLAAGGGLVQRPRPGVLGERDGAGAGGDDQGGGDRGEQEQGPRLHDEQHRGQDRGAVDREHGGPADQRGRVGQGRPQAAALDPGHPGRAEQQVRGHVGDAADHHGGEVPDARRRRGVASPDHGVAHPPADRRARWRRTAPRRPPTARCCSAAHRRAGARGRSPRRPGSPAATASRRPARAGRCGRAGVAVAAEGADPQDEGEDGAVEGEHHRPAEADQAQRPPAEQRGRRGGQQQQDEHGEPVDVRARTARPSRPPVVPVGSRVPHRPSRPRT